MTKKSRQKSPRKTHKVHWAKLLSKILLVFLCVITGFVIYQDAQLQKKFSGKRWSLPAYVYAHPLDLYLQQSIDGDVLHQELEILGYQQSAMALSPGSYTYQTDKDTQSFTIYTRDFQFPEAFENAQKFHIVIRNKTLQTLTTSTGDSMPAARLEPAQIGTIYPKHHQDRILLRLEDLPVQFPQILVATEDRYFYQHHGISIRGIVRALVANLRAGSTVQGGSTITQQLVKNFFLDQRRTLRRKLHEALLSTLLEIHYDKAEILEAYCNEIYLGQEGKRAIHGFGLGSQFYFGKPLHQLDIAQMALLIGIVKGPSYYNPFKHPKRAKTRRNVVLRLLAEQDIIVPDTVQIALNSPLNLVAAQHQQLKNNPSFLQLVHRQLLENYPPEKIQSEGLRIFTTLDPIIQKTAKRTLKKQLLILEKRHGLSPNHLESALILTHRQNGTILAFLGSRYDNAHGLNRALDVERPIGSLVKPAIYLTALQKSQQYTLSSVLQDAPITVENIGSTPWSPQNYDKKSHGDVLLYQALAQSYNQATVRLGMAIGLDSVINTLGKLGIQKTIPPYPSVLLGALELTPFQVSQMYQTITSGGFHIPLRAIRTVLTSQGEISSRYPITVEKRFSPQANYLTHIALTQVMKQGTGRYAYITMPKHMTLAGKTGTTDGLRDSWFVGYDQRYLSTIWIGNDLNKSVKLTGASGALNVWGNLMNQLQAQSILWPTPSNVQWFDIDPINGKRSSPHCKTVLKLPFIIGSEPKETSCSTTQRSKVIEWLQDLF